MKMMFMDNDLYKRIDIVDEVSHVLNLDDNLEKDCISLYDISLLYKDVNAKYETIKKYDYDKLESACYSRLNNMYKLKNINFDYKKQELIIEIDIFGEIVLKKIGDDLCITRSSIMTNEIFLNSIDILIDIYNDYMEYEGFINQNCFDIKVENSNFLVSINNWRVALYTTSNPLLFSPDFEVFSINSSCKYLYDCNSGNIMNFIKGREDEIFKHLYIKINKCPKWCWQDLIRMRENQLNIIEKKQKRKEMIKKILPFYRK